MAFLGILMSISSFFGYAQPVSPPIVIIPEVETKITYVGATSSVATSAIKTDSKVATSPPTVSVVATSTAPKAIPVPIPVPEKTPDTTPVVVGPCQTNLPVSTGSSTVSSTGAAGTQVSTIGTTTLVIGSVPLLSGGTAHAGGSVAVSYLQITNVGKECALLKGFWVKQNGSAPVESIIGLTTVDDKGGSRGSTGGIEGATPFQNGLALAPTHALFAPGQMRLFTIKAIITQDVSMYVGLQLMIEVASIETTAAVRGQFPIRGTTWVIAQ